MRASCLRVASSLPAQTNGTGNRSEGFYVDYSVPSSAAWATSVAREARRDPTKHSGVDHVQPPQRMTWKLRRQLEDYSQDMGDVQNLPEIACDSEDSD